ncbi:hypothetical protein KFL_000220210 [Klebsormidium nitens]|uniref:Cupin type-2 domain-containing protein n=1 Tax=Klebsormidium nitens TaxID=105231 RepID=A0A1Y1HK93_KLENI|nr:hypothetical protein KFL_000220210 [Klebsormidium nitens]|eukprot:GAQ78990.1 hypothetical protein KFL_000220210 [Klebsormidium nitens]
MAVTITLVALLLITSVSKSQSAETCNADAGGSVPLQFQPPTKNFGASSAPGGEDFLLGLPGFTRSHVEKDHALITPESRVWFTPPGWENALAAIIITPAMGAQFVMSLADLKANATIPSAPSGAQRFGYVIEGAVSTGIKGKKSKKVAKGGFFYAPSLLESKITSKEGALLVIIEKRHTFSPEEHALKLEPEFFAGVVDAQPVLPVPGEVFALRKLIPMTLQYDFNIHVMDFQPGEFLNVKEVHYNQHGLLLLEGQGIYRLADKWYPVQAGDAIWMAPFVPQWYGALGSTRSRYLIYKDNNRDPGIV